MKKGSIVAILFCILVFIELFIFFVPNIISYREVNKLNKEVLMVNDYINKGKGNIDEINNYIKKDIASSGRHELEVAIDSDLNDLISAYSEIVNMDKDVLGDVININFVKDELLNKIEVVNDYNEKLKTFKSSLVETDKNNYYKTSDNKLMNLYNAIVNKFDKNKLMNSINLYISNLDDKLQIYDYLNNNKDFYDFDNDIVFKKRSKFNEFNEIVNNVDVNVSFKLVKDEIGPVINANNISIREGDYLSVSDKVSCVDEVDDEVICDISGSYNNNVVGTYTITIRAKDTSDNESSKNINIIVKEKEKYNLPYIIEVIRNQSTTIVYGQDDNGDYTKIIGVFPCSPGAGTNTPVGTFYSRRGYPWGGLFGGVYGQYSTIITGHVLFHSVPYRSMNKDDLKWEYYNRLGSKDSMGCVRLTVKDAKWIYDNCPNGTMIKIYDGDLPNGVSKPSAQKIDPNDPRRGWDPTDPDPANPWNQ